LKEIKEALSLHTQLSLNKDLETDDYCVFAEKHDGRTIRFDKDIHDISELPFYTID